MPMDRSRYPDDWDAIALAVKEKVGWICQRCGKQCLRPGEKMEDSSDRAVYTLTVHHRDFLPENNNPANLIPLCAPCHLRLHAGHKRNLPPGQMKLDIQL